MNWLFLRGLTREQRHWGEFPRIFESSVPGAKVHCLDLPGTGTEILRHSPATMRGIAADVRARWLKLKAGHDGEWGLLSISLGGMVAMQWSADHPADFKRLVFISTSAGNLSLPWERLSWKIIPRLALTATTQETFTRERRIVELTTSMLTDIDRVAGEWASFANDPGRLRDTFVRQIAAATLFRAPPKLPVPALFLASIKDPFTSSACSFKLARHFGATAQFHPAAGHEVPIDDPRWVTDQVKAWL